MAWRRPGDKPLSEPMMVSWSLGPNELLTLELATKCPWKFRFLIATTLYLYFWLCRLYLRQSCFMPENGNTKKTKYTRAWRTIYSVSIVTELNLPGMGLYVSCNTNFTCCEGRLDYSGSLISSSGAYHLIIHPLVYHFIIQILDTNYQLLVMQRY